MRTFRSSLCLILASTFLAATCLAEAPDRIAAIDSSQTVVLAKSVHPNAQSRYDQGPVEASRQLSYITLLIAPSPTQQKALDRLLAQQQDPHSPNYHKWLTPAEFADRFGLSQNDLNKVTGWLRSQGLKIVSVGGGRNSVIFSGTAAHVQSAFGTEIHGYKVDGEEHFANSTPLMLPAALSGIVKTVMGLHDFRPRPANRKSGIGALRSARPDYYDATYLFPNFLAPGDIATIYGIDSLYAQATPVDGTGQKLAVVGQTDIFLADINDFRSGFGLTPIPTGTGGCTTSTTGTTGIIIAPCTTTNFAYVLLGTDPLTISTGDITEADLDVEWSGAVARNAQIIFVNGETSGGAYDALTAAINPPSGPPIAPVISMSYGNCEAQSPNLETLLQQGNAEGVTILNSAGDTGAAACDFSPTTANPPFPPASNGLAVNYPASSPEVTAVGGTEISLADDSVQPNSFWSATIGANGGTATMYIPEIAWNDDVEFGLFCVANPTNTFCTQGGSTAVPGWVKITSAETAQQDIWISSTGGGASNCFTVNGTTCTAGFPQPVWQKPLTVSGAPAGVRWLPDVSLFASPNFPGYILCTPQNPGTTNTSTCSVSVFDAVDTFQSLVGGTSASTPVFAGMITLLNQFFNGAGSGGLGNINAKLYQLAATPANQAFHPVTSGTNIVYCAGATPTGQPTTIQCPAPSGTTGSFGYNAANVDTTGGTSYNLVTGLGSVKADSLFAAWQASLGSFTLSPDHGTVTAIAGHNSTTSTITMTPTSPFNSPVIYSCPAPPAGATCSFNPSTATTSPVVLTFLTSPSMGPATNPVTVSANGGGVTETTTVTLTTTATDQVVTLSVGTASLQVTPGQTGTATINVKGTNSFNAQLSFTCTEPAALSASGSVCTMSPPTPTTAASVTLSVTTLGPTGQLRQPLTGGKAIFYAALLPGLLGIVFTAGSRKRAARGIRFLSLMMVLGFSTLWLGACSSNSSNKTPGTPPGSYALTVLATTGGTVPVTASTTVTLVVQ
ncbi:MAG TPA: S53 family peptidase [Candidatus Sulfotelmatobacter sp.]|nr:S53 family peptidase [Candidatus Sulfotelmatobacter sp.]